MKFRVVIQKEGAPDETRVVEAAARLDVYHLIEQEGGTVRSIEEERGSSIIARLNSITIGGNVKRQDIITFAKNLSAMLNAGLSLARALSVIERQSGNQKLKVAVTGLSEAIRKGSSFHEALAQYSKIFPTIFIAMAKSGEESGSLAEALSIVALQMERSEELSKKIKGAMIYPSIVVVAIIIVAVLMLIYVVPTLTKTFVSLNVAIPLSTQIIVAVSNFMAANVLLVFVLLAVLFVGGTAAGRSRMGQRVIIWCALRMPAIGELVRETFAARAARTLSSLLSSGVPILDALGIAGEVVHAEAFTAVITEATQAVKKGEPLSASFAAHPNLYPLLMGDMLAVGEETGKIAEMLKQVAEFYEADVAEKTKDLSTIIEPVLMLFIGLVVGVFAVSIIAPIYLLSSAI